MKLAAYNPKGKFEGFKELGVDFLFGGEFIYLPKGIPEPRLWENGEQEELYGSLFKRDEKDPLNRFNGLFNGRTFGNGRFVLEVNNQDFVLGASYFPSPTKFFIKGSDEHYYPTSNFLYEGNLHENPELFEKISKL